MGTGPSHNAVWNLALKPKKQVFKVVPQSQVAMVRHLTLPTRHPDPGWLCLAVYSNEANYLMRTRNFTCYCD